jgi:lipoprotein-anchoring transpeptidase ErfK/SrfK
VLPDDEEIVFDGTLFVPPFGTANRRIAGELGRYKLDLGDGYLLHGTRDADSVGGASTHGCLRLRADNLELLYRGVPVGTDVYIF